MSESINERIDQFDEESLNMATRMTIRTADVDDNCKLVYGMDFVRA